MRIGVYSLVFVATLASSLTAADPLSGCNELIAEHGYGYRQLFRLDEIARRVGDRFELDFYVQSAQVVQILLTSEEGAWPGAVGTPYEIQNYNNEVFMVNRRNQIAAKAYRHRILDALTPVPLILRVHPQNATFELQLDGELAPFIRYTDPQPIANISHVAFGTHGPNVARYFYGCDANQEADNETARPLCAVGRPKIADVRSLSNGTTAAAAQAAAVRVRLRDLWHAEKVRTANETFHAEFTVTRPDNVSSVRVVLHARGDYEEIGSPYYDIELGDTYTMRRRGVLVASRRPNVDLLKHGRQVVVNVAVKEDGQVHIWLNNLRTQLLRFREAYPIDLRYVTFRQGLWTYKQCA